MDGAIYHPAARKLSPSELDEIAGLALESLLKPDVRWVLEELANERT
jgi:hypothetical protein